MPSSTTLYNIRHPQLVGIISTEPMLGHRSRPPNPLCLLSTEASRTGLSRGYRGSNRGPIEGHIEGLSSLVSRTQTWFQIWKSIKGSYAQSVKSLLTLSLYIAYTKLYIHSAGSLCERLLIQLHRSRS